MSGDDLPRVTVLRLGHRPGRDDRMTTHVGLTARALGADAVVFEDRAAEARETVADVTDRFGGPFETRTTTQPKGLIRDWDGLALHCTMYGESVSEVLPSVRTRHRAGERVLIAVGAEKVPFDVYEAADANVAVTNQPHSEVAALAIVLDRLFEGRELDREWDDADRRVVPRSTGKQVESGE